MHLFKFSKKSLVLISLFFLSSGSWADTPWRFEIAPYLWAISMTGKTYIGRTSANVNESFNEILDHLDFGGMLYTTAHKDNFGLYLNAIYAVTSVDGTFGPIDSNVKNKFGIFGSGVSYIVYDHLFQNQSKLQLEPTLGARYTLNNTTLKINIDNFSVSKNVNWTDPVVGLNLLYDFNARWSLILNGDVGGTNTTTHYSYSAGGDIGYHPSSPSLKHISTYLGYRMLKQRYSTSSGRSFYEWNMRLYGPLLGVALDF